MGRAERITEKIHLALSAGFLTEGDLDALRGDLMFLMTTSYGRIARAGFGGFKRPREAYYQVSGMLYFSLLFFLRVMNALQPREIPLIFSFMLSAIVYTDAAYEEDPNDWLEAVATMGSLILKGPDRIGRAAHISKKWLNALVPRKNQILPCELLALLAVLMVDGEGSICADAKF